MISYEKIQISGSCWKIWTSELLDQYSHMGNNWLELRSDHPFEWGLYSPRVFVTETITDLLSIDI